VTTNAFSLRTTDALPSDDDALHSRRRMLSHSRRRTLFCPDDGMLSLPTTNALLSRRRMLLSPDDGCFSLRTTDALPSDEVAFV